MKNVLKKIPTIVLYATRIVLFLLFLLVSYQVVIRLLENTVLKGSNIVVGLVAIWAIIAYVVIPRIHRLLVKLYLPDYFIGRVRTNDGLLGDPVNLGVMGSKKQLIGAMTEAGWHIADELTWKSTLKMISSTLRKKSYPTAPVSSLFLFQKKQDIAFQIEVDGNPHARHHVRFWKTPKQWWLPGGHEADWVGAATYDTRVGFSVFTGQFTHKIEENVDIERDFVVHSVTASNTLASTERVEHFMTAFRSRNGGGDRIATDGALLFLHLEKL